jgi:hypothetical protein
MKMGTKALASSAQARPTTTGDARRELPANAARPVGGDTRVPEAADIVGRQGKRDASSATSSTVEEGYMSEWDSRLT